MISIHIKKIQYDIENKSDLKGLPKSLKMTLDYDYEHVMEDKRNGSSLDDIEEAISDFISDNTGFCHNGFVYTIKKVS